MKYLPTQPNLDYLRREAKSLKSSHRMHDKNICEIIGHFDLSLHNLSNHDIFKHQFSILDAQRVVARQYGFASWRRMKLYVERCSSTNDIDSGLRNELLVRKAKVDEFTLSTRGRKYRNSPEPIETQLAEEAASFLNPVFDQHGWPGPELVGRDGMEACFLILGIAVLDSALNLRACELMRNKLPSGAVQGYWYANLSDRYLALCGKPTVYGTTPEWDEKGEFSLSKDVIDPQNLDKRRARVGFNSFDRDNEYVVKRANENGDKIECDRAEFESYKHRISKLGGYILSA